MNPSFIPLAYRDGRKKIINQLGKFTPSSVLETLIAELRMFERGGIERMRDRPPWHTLLLLKWFFADSRSHPGNTRAMTEMDFVKLIYSVVDLEGKLELPSQHPDFAIFLRKVAHQQFWFQENLQVAHFARQSLLFRQLPMDHPLSVAFARVVGVPIGDFVVLLAAMTIYLAVRNVPVDRRFFSSLEPFFSRSKVDAVLATISKDRSELRTYLRSGRFADARAHYEYHSRTPLTRYPLLRDGGHLIPYAPAVLARGVETLVYDILREHDASAFMNHFGTLFEGHVRKGVEHTEFPFMDEAELTRRFGRGKVVDFAFSSLDGTLLVDAKGVALPVGALVTDDTEFLTSRLSNSVIKALEQAAGLASRMALVDPPFVLVVTYKHFLLGTGSNLERFVDKDAQPESVKGLDMAKVYFASIEEFDYLVAGLRAHRIHPVQFFANARDLDADPSTRKFTVMQHVNAALRPYGTPDYLSEEEAAVMKILERALPVQIVRANGVAGGS